MTPDETIDISPYLSSLNQLDLLRWRGVITDVTGFVVESNGPASRLGGFCEIHASNGRTIRTQVAGFRNGRILSIPLEEIDGLQPGDPIYARSEDSLVPVGPGLLGRVLDGFGHVSARHATDPDRFLISRSRSPQFVQPRDICEFNLDSCPVQDGGGPHYAERVIHGCVYRARPDVIAVCHLHAPSVLPFANSGTPIVPVLHLGALIGTCVTFWDARDGFGDTDMLVSTLEQGHSLARALGPHWAVLMRRHGAVVAGRSVREVVFRAVCLKLNAEVQLQTHALGGVSRLTEAEVELSAAANLRQSVQDRVWEYWSSRLAPVAEPAIQGKDT